MRKTPDRCRDIHQNERPVLFKRVEDMKDRLKDCCKLGKIEQA
jgi:hypothetical protein